MQKCKAGLAGELLDAVGFFFKLIAAAPFAEVEGGHELRAVVYNQQGALLGKAPYFDGVGLLGDFPVSDEAVVDEK